MRRLVTHGLWLVFAIAAVRGAFAETFSYTRGAEHFEAVVTEERVVVKERFQGATTIYGDLSCPLGPAVKARPVAAAPSRLCLIFAKNRCDYTRYQNGVAIHTDELAKSPAPKMCVVLANARDARRFASLVNAGPGQPKERPGAKAEASAAGAGDSPKVPSATPSSAADERSERRSARQSRPSTQQPRKTKRSTRKSPPRTKSAMKAPAAKPPATAPMPPVPTTPAHAHE
jgi:hypothetical protein